MYTSSPQRAVIVFLTFEKAETAFFCVFDHFNIDYIQLKYDVTKYKHLALIYCKNYLFRVTQSVTAARQSQIENTDFGDWREADSNLRERNRHQDN